MSRYLLNRNPWPFLVHPTQQVCCWAGPILFDQNQAGALTYSVRAVSSGGNHRHAERAPRTLCARGRGRRWVRTPLARRHWPLLRQKPLSCTWCNRPCEGCTCLSRRRRGNSGCSPSVPATNPIHLTDLLVKIQFKYSDFADPYCIIPSSLTSDFINYCTCVFEYTSTFSKCQTV